MCVFHLFQCFHSTPVRKVYTPYLTIIFVC